MSAKRMLFLRTILMLLAMSLTQVAGAEEGERGGLLAKEMRYAQAFDDAKVICMEQADGLDVEKEVSDTPGLLGGIVPEDADWQEAKALYIRMLKSGCVYDGISAERAFAQAIGQSLSATEIDELIAFYRSRLGARFLHASLEANRAANRATKPLPESETAYDVYERDLLALLARRSAPAAAAPEKVRVVQALESADAAVALSDRIMQGIVRGAVRDAIELGLPHTVVTAEKLDTLIQQIDEQQPIRAERYGASLDYELLRNDSGGGSLLRTVFLHRHERYAVIWQFIWYRGKDGWVLTNLSYADDLTLLFR